MIEGFHLLFHERGLPPLFHPLSASFSQKNHFFGVFQVYPAVPLLSEYAPKTTLQVEEKKIARRPILLDAVQIFTKGHLTWPNYSACTELLNFSFQVHNLKNVNVKLGHLNPMKLQ